jgi:hypothetical protein
MHRSNRQLLVMSLDPSAKTTELQRCVGAMSSNYSSKTISRRSIWCTKYKESAWLQYSIGFHQSMHWVQAKVFKNLHHEDSVNGGIGKWYRLNLDVGDQVSHYSSMFGAIRGVCIALALLLCNAHDLTPTKIRILANRGLVASNIE